MNTMFKEKIINGLTLASNCFDNFYTFGFFFLIVLNTISLIIVFAFLAVTYIDNSQIFPLILMVIRVLSYVLIFWIVSFGLSIIFKTIADIMYKRQEKDIVNNLQKTLPVVKLKRGKNAKLKGEI